MSFIKVETLGIEDDTNDESRSTEDNDPYLQSLVAHTFDQGSIPHRKGKGKESSEGEDPLNGLEIVNEGCFELPMELTENGLEVLKDAEVTMKTTIPPSRVGGPWSGTMEGRSTIGATSNSASGSISLDYKASSWSNLSFGMIRGHELFHPLISIGGSLVRGGSTVGVTFYHNITYLHAMLLEHSMYSFSFRHLFPNSRWVFMSELTRRQVLNLSLSNTKVAGTMGWDLRKPKDVEMRVDIRPKISKDRRAHLFCQLKPGVWQLGASVFQFLHSQVASVGLGLRLYSLRGLEWVFSWNRGDALIRIPILISRGGMKYTNFLQMLYFSMISFFIQEGLAEMWGWKALPDEEEATISPEILLRNITKLREDAMLQRDLMTRQAKRRKREEQEKDGLLIQKALYQAVGGDTWEVTIPLQFWVSHSSLNLPPVSKSEFLGFYDVSACLKTKSEAQDHSSTWWNDLWNDLWDLTAESAARKSPQKIPNVTLAVEYKFRGQLYSITIQDQEELLLPHPKAKRL